MIISAALDRPIEWASIAAMPPPPIQPSLISGAAKRALLDARRISHNSPVSSPPPSAWPFTDALLGFSRRWLASQSQDLSRTPQGLPYTYSSTHSTPTHT